MQAETLRGGHGGSLGATVFRVKTQTKNKNKNKSLLTSLPRPADCVDLPPVRKLHLLQGYHHLHPDSHV